MLLPREYSLISTWRMTSRDGGGHWRSFRTPETWPRYSRGSVVGQSKSRESMACNSSKKNYDMRQNVPFGSTDCHFR